MGIQQVKNQYRKALLGTCICVAFVGFIKFKKRLSSLVINIFYHKHKVNNLQEHSSVRFKLIKYPQMEIPNYKSVLYNKTLWNISFILRKRR